MRKLVIVPTYQRSDLLYCCLEAIRAAEPMIDIHVFPDRGTKEDDICAKFNAVPHLVLNHNLHGNSYNMLEALKWASTRADRVYVVEDDAIIDPSFFNWAEQALEMFPDMFAAAGWQYSPDAKISDGPDVRIPWYLSVCAALPAGSVHAIVQHARVEYYNDMQGYLDRTFPSSHRKGSAHFEQDGLALRVMESRSQRCIWPRRPRTTHVGWYGYHMAGKKLEGTLKERTDIIKLAVKNPELLAQLMSGGIPPDLDKCSICLKPLLSTNKTAEVTCEPCFSHKFPNRPRTSTSVYYTKPSALEPTTLPT